MIDYLSLTINLPPDRDYIENHGEITEDKNKKQIYLFMCKFDRAIVLFLPYKFSDRRNSRTPFTKVILNPKNFSCYEEMDSYLFAIFDKPDLKPKDFKISRIDIAADIEGLLGESLLATLNIKHIRMETFSFFKGTIYGGASPKIRIYNKVKEIKARLKKGKEISEYEKGLLESDKKWTRFEIEIKKPKKTLKDIIDNPESFASYFDRLEFFNHAGNENSGIMQIMYKNINRKFRKQLEELKDSHLVEKIKAQYIESVTKWLTPKEPF
jgi:hypothetical protein